MAKMEISNAKIYVLGGQQLTGFNVEIDEKFAGRGLPVYSSDPIVAAVNSSFNRNVTKFLLDNHKINNYSKKARKYKW